MDLSRRHFMVLTTSAMAGMMVGCNKAADLSARPDAELPSVAWPELAAAPTPTGKTFDFQPVRATAQPRQVIYQKADPVTPVQRTTAQPTQQPVRTVAAAVTMPPILARTRWTQTAPKKHLINAMNGVRHITIHHEGAPKKPVWFDDEKTTVRRLQQIQKYHMSRGWADVGYHYIIDRAGRIWEARSVGYQGAHVKDHNPKNIGIMVLGNFDLQTPSNPQLITLQSFVKGLRAKYKVPVARVKTHQELMPTACPGKHLQPKIASLRSNGRFG